MNRIKNIVKVLTEEEKTISTMESCTGGGVANAITNIPGASEVFKFGVVTYSNEFKIKMGVSKDIIDKYSVYSMEVAKDMSKVVSMYANSNYGIGITGKLKRIDKRNINDKDNIVYVSVYDKDKNKYYTDVIEVYKRTRKENKNIVIDRIMDILDTI